jgi:hypothetical protein
MQPPHSLIKRQTCPMPSIPNPRIPFMTTLRSQPLHLKCPDPQPPISDPLGSNQSSWGSLELCSRPYATFLEHGT